jgi:hypothetical protein
MMKTQRQILFIFVLMILAGCTAVRDIYEQPLTASDISQLQGIQQGIIHGQGVEKVSPGEPAEVQMDKKILEAVRQMVATLKPEYKQYSFRKHRLGFMEISDIENRKPNRLHKYISEKALTFSFLQQTIAENINIVERFLLKDVMAELKLEKNYNIIDQRTAKRLGDIYGVDLIETGVITESHDFIDLNLRMIETRRGRIVAVGSVKIEKTEPVRQWIKHMNNSGFDYEDYMSF